MEPVTWLHDYLECPNILVKLHLFVLGHKHIHVSKNVPGDMILTTQVNYYHCILFSELNRMIMKTISNKYHKGFKEHLIFCILVKVLS